MSLSRVQPSKDQLSGRGPAIVDLGPIGPRGRGAYKLRSEAVGSGSAPEVTRAPAGSPVASVRAMLKAFVVTVLVVSIVGARGIVETARTMPAGPAESIAMTVGNISLAVQQILPVGFLWNDFSAAIGHPVQPDHSRLLAEPTPTPTPVHTRTGGSGGKGGGPTSGRGGRHTTKPPTAPPWPNVRPITKSHPLNLLVMGDSLPGFLGPEILTMAHAQGPVFGTTQAIDGTGLTRPDTYDWDYYGPRFVRQTGADAVIVLMGGNDFQNMTLPHAFFLAGTKGWTREYQRRAQIVMHDLIAAGARRVYWLSMPPSGDGGAVYAHDYHQIDVALRAAAKQVPGIRYVDINPAVTYRGRYVDYKKLGGQLTLIREVDGIHLNVAGSQLAANVVVPIVKRDWRFGWSQVRERWQGKRHPGRRWTRRRP